MGSERSSRAPALIVVAVLALAGVAAIAALGSGPFGHGHDEPAPPSEAARAAAERSGQAVVDDSVRIGVDASGATDGWSGWSAWFFRTERGVDAAMIVDPDGEAIKWGGCNTSWDGSVRQCTAAAASRGAVVREVYFGAARPGVAGVVLRRDDGSEADAVMGDRAVAGRGGRAPVDDPAAGTAAPVEFTARDTHTRVTGRSPVRVR